MRKFKRIVKAQVILSLPISPSVERRVTRLVTDLVYDGCDLWGFYNLLEELAARVSKVDTNWNPFDESRYAPSVAPSQHVDWVYRLS